MSESAPPPSESAILENAILTGADLRDAELARVRLDGANLNRAHLEGVDLSRAQDLTQEQVEQANGAWFARLPTDLERPEFEHRGPEPG